jgi:peptidoglycan hydrolase CwlO-like protein
MDYARRAQAIEQRLKELIQAYQQAQATVQQIQQEIYEYQGRLKEVREQAEETRSRVHDGDRSGAQSGISPSTLRPPAG